MKKTIKWFAVLAAMVMGLSFAGCSDSSDDDDDDDVVVPTVKEAKTSVDVKTVAANDSSVYTNNGSDITRILLSYTNNSETTYYYSNGENWYYKTGTKPTNASDLDTSNELTDTILVADGKYYLQKAVYERDEEAETIEGTFTYSTQTLTFKAGNKVDYCEDTTDPTNNTTEDISYTNNAGVLTVVIDSGDPDQNMTALYDGKTSIYEVTALEAEDVSF